MCFSGVNLDIAALQKPTTINIAFCGDAIVAVWKTATICNCSSVEMTAAIGTYFAVLFLSYSGGLDRRNRPLNFPL